MKAKLEIEMPEGCYDCQFCAGTECGVAEGMPTIDLFGEEGLRPKWCPLIPEEITRSRRDWYLKGYNDAKKERDWIPVSEQLPEGNGIYCLVTTIRSCRVEMAWYSNGDWYWNNSDQRMGGVVAWMPIPGKYRIV